LREAISRCRSRSTRHYNQTSSDNIDVRHLLDRHVEVSCIEVILILLVQVTSVSKAKTEPTSRVDLHAADYINWTVFECVDCATTDILSRPNFRDWLEVLVDWYREILLRQQEGLFFRMG